MNWQEVVQECHEEWHKMHHNASISGYYPDFQNEYEEHLFWDCLGGYVRDEVEYLQEWIEEKFGFTLKFYSYGRQGATIAPGNWMSPVGGSGFGGFAEHKVLEYPYSGLEGYNADRKVLKCLEFINEFWHEDVKCVKEWWEETKEASEWQEDIDAHDGKNSGTRM